ncbi:MAG: SDR family oxidoreductase [Gammaproteobacteria bacterium]|nr:SDR family oxidoreductase [Gammaproteobacteria bacterium]
MKTFLKIVGGLVVVLLLIVASAWVAMMPNVPDEQWVFETDVPAEPRNFLIFGATRHTGLEVAKILTARGDSVTVFVRESSDRSQVEPLGVDFVVGDALDADSVRAAFASDNFDAVLTTIGSLRAETPPDYLGNKNIFDAAAEAGVDRVIMISTVGAGDSYDAMPWLSELMLAEVAKLKTQAEDHLKALGLNYTIIRPGGMPYDGGTGGGILSEDPSAFGFIARPDVARLVVGAFDDTRTIGRTFAAMDPVRTSILWAPEQ